MVIHSHEMREVLLVTASWHHNRTGHHTSTAAIGISNPTFSHQATQFHQLSSTSDRFEKSNSAE